MGIYKVQLDGYAPPGLRVGDQVVTGGGTYLITVVNSDGSYQSRLINDKQTTRNYGGAYDSAGGSSGNQSAPSLPGSSSENVRKLQEMTRKISGSGYQPVVEIDNSAALSTLSFEDALALAEQVMEPQYTSRYQQSAANAAQRLEQAGLYDTLYGQALAADAEQDITRDLNSAIYALALQLSSASREEALDLLRLAVDERQFGANYDAKQRESALNYLLKLLQGESAV